MAKQKEEAPKSMVSITSDAFENEAKPLNHELSYELRKLSKADLELRVLHMTITLQDLVAENKRLKEELKNATK